MATRINQVQNHLGTTNNTSSSVFSSLNSAPPDPILSLNTLFKSDPTPNKINVGVGAYRTEQGKPFVLNCVRKAEQLLSTCDHEYLPMSGLNDFSKAAVKLILGTDSSALSRSLGFQSLSGTGALRIGAEFLKRFRPASVYVSAPTWGNHHAIFGDVGLTSVKTYQYWDPNSKGLAFSSFKQTLLAAPNGSIFVLHGCAHNPTGVDPTRSQWMEIEEIMRAKGHFPFFDVAYQGFATGDLDVDAWAIRYFVEKGHELFVAQSFAKNLGLYGQRAGNLTIVLKDAGRIQPVFTNMCKIVRAMYSNPPAHGARIAQTVLTTPELYKEWTVELKGMANRIIEMRKMLFDLLTQKYKTPGNWNHITDQIGMFSFTGLNPNQCKALVEKHHIYLTSNGRISIAGLNKNNIQRFAECMDNVVRNVQ